MIHYERWWYSSLPRSITRGLYQVLRIGRFILIYIYIYMYVYTCPYIYIYTDTDTDIWFMLCVFVASMKPLAEVATSQYWQYWISFVVWKIFCVSISWVSNHPNWRTHMFQRGGSSIRDIYSGLMFCSRNSWFFFHQSMVCQRSQVVSSPLGRVVEWKGSQQQGYTYIQVISLYIYICIHVCIYIYYIYIYLNTYIHARWGLQFYGWFMFRNLMKHRHIMWYPQ